jgi:hypothetical protein
MISQGLHAQLARKTGPNCNRDISAGGNISAPRSVISPHPAAAICITSSVELTAAS